MKLRGRLTYHLSLHTRATVLRLWARAIESMPYIRTEDRAWATDVVTRVLTYVRALTDEAAPLDAIQRKDVAKGILDTQGITEALAYSAVKALQDAVDVLDAFERSVGYARSFSDAVSRPSDTAVRSTEKALSDVVSQYNETVSRVFGKSLTDTPSTAELVARSTSKPITDAAVTSELVRRTPSKSLPADQFTVADVASRVYSGIRSVTDSRPALDVAFRAAGKGLSDTLSLAETFSMALSKSLSEDARYAVEGYFADNYVTAGLVPADSITVTLNP